MVPSAHYSHALTAPTVSANRAKYNMLFTEVTGKTKYILLVQNLFLMHAELAISNGDCQLS